jgi:hypothetical protein
MRRSTRPLQQLPDEAAGAHTACLEGVDARSMRPLQQLPDGAAGPCVLLEGVGRNAGRDAVIVQVTA